jgi:hypothetical protein
MARTDAVPCSQCHSSGGMLILLTICGAIGSLGWAWLLLRRETRRKHWTESTDQAPSASQPRYEGGQEPTDVPMSMKPLVQGASGRARRDSLRAPRGKSPSRTKRRRPRVTECRYSAVGRRSSTHGRFGALFLCLFDAGNDAFEPIMVAIIGKVVLIQAPSSDDLGQFCVVCRIQTVERGLRCA